MEDKKMKKKQEFEFRYTARCGPKINNFRYYVWDRTDKKAICISESFSDMKQMARLLSIMDYMASWGFDDIMWDGYEKGKKK